jgi:2-C-methyl-D-erythritol 4-phosphate cytidylyltransferase
MNPLQNFVVIVAAGKGLRMGSAVKKQYLCLKGMPVLSQTITAFDACDAIREIVLVIPDPDHDYIQHHILAPFNFSKKIHLVAGGKERQESVLNGLNRVKDQVNARVKNREKDQIEDPVKGQADTDNSNLFHNTIVLIHDGVRPFVDQGLIKASIDGARKFGACIPGLPITDTVKQAGLDGLAQKTMDRTCLYTVQTPQAFRLDLILRAFAHAHETGFVGTDDASLVEHMGQKVRIIKGDKLNIKITTPEDLDWGEFFLNL